MVSTEKVYQLFKELNGVPRPSWHEEKVADWLCQNAKRAGLAFERDAHNCVVIRKEATPGHEAAETIVLHAHMDMVCVAEKGKSFDPLKDGIEAYVEDGWMKAQGTSLGADNGIGLCMALAVMLSDDLVHGPLELLVTTNEEDGMTGAQHLSEDFVKGRKMIDLDSEDYDVITVGAAGAYLQTASLPFTQQDTPEGCRFYLISISGGLGGHSGVDIGKGRMSAVKEICHLLAEAEKLCPSLMVAEINAGEANASIPANAEAVVGVAADDAERLTDWAKQLQIETEGDKNVQVTVEDCETPTLIINKEWVEKLVSAIEEIPFGVIKMSENMPGTVETSNNIGVIRTEQGQFRVTSHSRSFLYDVMVQLGEHIGSILRQHGFATEVVMSTPAWEENPESEFMHLVEQSFEDVLGFRPRKVEMHFVMEMGYFVQKFKGIQIIPIGPRIIEPHSTSERVELETIDNIYQVLVEILRREA